MTIEHFRPVDIRNALSHIRQQEDDVLTATDTHERQGTTASEVTLVLALSELEILYSNFATYIKQTTSFGAPGRF